jgi:hypothetical protein
MLRARCPLLLAAAIVAFSCISQNAPAQQPKAVSPIVVPPQAPTINVPVPMGIQRGTSLEVTLTGANLTEPVSVWTNFPAKTSIPTDNNNGKDAGKLRVKFDVAADCPVGLYTIRVSTVHGVSNSRTFCVDDLPAVSEVETNHKKEMAQVVPIPCVITGRTDSEMSDFFKIAVKPGQRVTFEVLGRRLGSPLDPILLLYDARSGRELPGLYSDDAPGAQTDARLTHTFKEGGEFIVELRDTTHRGGPDYHYRLRIGDFPIAVTAFPVALKRGTKGLINFAGPSLEGVMPVEVVAPTDPGIPVVYVAPKGAGGISGWPVPVLLSNHDEAAEQEPNNEPAKANRLSVPGGVTGRFLEKGDLDHYVFTAKKGQKYTINADTYDVNSPAEVYLILKKPDGSEAGKSNPQQTSARIDFTAEVDGDYLIVAEHLNYVHGPNEVYYLTVRPAEPDFEVNLGLDRFDIAPGDTALIPILSVVRRDYAGPIELSVVGHPGLSGAATIPAGAAAPPPNQSLALMPLAARPDVPPGPYEFRVQARANVNGKEIVRFANVADLVKQNMNGLPFPPREMLTALAVGVTGKPPFKLAVAFAPQEVLRGIPVNLTATATRDAGFAEEIGLTAVGLPPNVAAAVKPVPKGGNDIAIQMTAPANAPLGSFLITFRGTAKHQGKDFAYYAGPVPLNIVLPMDLKLEPATLAIKPGEKAKLKVIAVRRGGYNGPIDVELKNLPANVTAAKVLIGQGQSSAELEVTAAANAAAGDKPDVNAVGTATGVGNQQATSPNVTVRVAK